MTTTTTITSIRTISAAAAASSCSSVSTLSTGHSLSTSRSHSLNCCVAMDNISSFDIDNSATATPIPTYSTRPSGSTINSRLIAITTATTGTSFSITTSPTGPTITHVQSSTCIWRFIARCYRVITR